MTTMLGSFLGLYWDLYNQMKQELINNGLEATSENMEWFLNLYDFNVDREGDDIKLSFTPKKEEEFMEIIFKEIENVQKNNK